MSALGHKRTFSHVRAMSALAPKANINRSERYVCFVPKRTLALSAPRRALGDDVDDLERHHYFAGLIDYLDERGDRAAIGL
jgi:hypothetical protein